MTTIAVDRENRQCFGPFQDTEAAIRQMVAYMRDEVEEMTPLEAAEWIAVLDAGMVGRAEADFTDAFSITFDELTPVRSPMYRAASVESSIEEDNRAAMIGRLTDFHTYLGTLDDPMCLEPRYFGERRDDAVSQLVMNYVAGAEENEDPKPEWLGARNFGRIEE